MGPRGGCRPLIIGKRVKIAVTTLPVLGNAKFVKKDDKYKSTRKCATCIGENRSPHPHPEMTNTKYEYNDWGDEWVIKAIKCPQCEIFYKANKLIHASPGRIVQCKSCDPSTDKAKYEFCEWSNVWAIRSTARECDLCSKLLWNTHSSGEWPLIVRCSDCVSPTVDEKYIKLYQVKTYKGCVIGYDIDRIKIYAEATNRHLWRNPNYVGFDLSAVEIVNYRCACSKCTAALLPKTRKRKRKSDARVDENEKRICGKR